MSASRPIVKREGYIEKWRNYFFLYYKRWFVIENGQMTYYNTPSETSCKSLGTIHLAKAIIEPKDKNKITIDCGGVQTLYLKLASEEDRNNWLSTLNLAKKEAMWRAEEAQRITANIVEASQNQRQLETDLQKVKEGKDRVKKDAQKLDTAMAQMEQASGAAEATSHFHTVRQRSQALRDSSTKMVEKSKNFCNHSKSQVDRLKSGHLLYCLEEIINDMQDLQNRMQNVESEPRRNTSSRVADGESDPDAGAETEMAFALEMDSASTFNRV